MAKKLPVEFFLRPDVVTIARDLIGKMLLTRVNNAVAGGLIVETEAYGGVDDRASHAFGGRRTARTAVMYRTGGVAYVYLCYGIHCLFNIITNRAEIPHAVLIRAIEPCCGIELMRRRRGKKCVDKSLTRGPGAMSRALGINLKHNGLKLTGNRVWLENGDRIDADRIEAVARVGVEYAGIDALRPWRFLLRGNPWVSRPLA